MNLLLFRTPSRWPIKLIFKQNKINFGAIFKKTLQYSQFILLFATRCTENVLFVVYITIFPQTTKSFVLFIALFVIAAPMHVSKDKTDSCMQSHAPAHTAVNCTRAPSALTVSCSLQRYEARSAYTHVFKSQSLTS